jgi:hypothetical protein
MTYKTTRSIFPTFLPKHWYGTPINLNLAIEFGEKCSKMDIRSFSPVSRREKVGGNDRHEPVHTDGDSVILTWVLLW